MFGSSLLGKYNMLKPVLHAATLSHRHEAKIPYHFVKNSILYSYTQRENLY